jgi:hypothetical protein
MNKINAMDVLKECVQNNPDMKWEMEGVNVDELYTNKNEQSNNINVSTRHENDRTENERVTYIRNEFVKIMSNHKNILDKLNQDGKIEQITNSPDDMINIIDQVRQLEIDEQNKNNQTGGTMPIGSSKIEDNLNLHLEKDEINVKTNGKNNKTNNKNNGSSLINGTILTNETFSTKNLILLLISVVLFYILNTLYINNTISTYIPTLNSQYLYKNIFNTILFALLLTGSIILINFLDD